MWTWTQNRIVKSRKRDGLGRWEGGRDSNICWEPTKCQVLGILSHWIIVTWLQEVRSWFPSFTCGFPVLPSPSESSILDCQPARYFWLQSSCFPHLCTCAGCSSQEEILVFIVEYTTTLKRLYIWQCSQILLYSCGVLCEPLPHYCSYKVGRK